MKRILSILLVLLLTLTVFTGCEQLNGIVDMLPIDIPGLGTKECTHDYNAVVTDPTCTETGITTKTCLLCGDVQTCDETAALGHNFVKGVCSRCDAVDPNYVDQDLKSAYDYVHQMIKGISTETIGNYDLVLTAVVGEKSYTVVWEIIGTDAVVIEDGKVIVPEAGATAINYTLKFTVTNEKGETLSREYNKVVPKFAYNSFADYAAAENDKPLVVAGVVAGVFSKSTGSKVNGLFVQDLNNEGGYYVYNLTDDVYETIKPGMTVEVKGNKTNYSGTYEIINASVKVLDSTIKPVVPVDYTDLVNKAGALTDAALVEKQGMLVTIKGVTILEAGDNGYYYFQAGAHKIYLRISGSNNPCTAADLEAVKAVHGANFGNTADVTGIITIYNKAFYLSPVSADAFHNVQASDKTDAEIIDIELGNVKFDGKIYEDSTITLPLQGTNYTNVKFAWTSDNAAAVVDGSSLKITVPETDTVVTISVTATLNAESVTKTYTIKLSKTVLTVSDALALAAGKDHNQYTEEKYLITGVIDTLESDIYGNCWLVGEDGARIYVYGIYTKDGSGKYETLSYKPVVGDTVTIFAVVGYYSDKEQVKSGWLVSYVKGEGNNEEPVDPQPPVTDSNFELTVDSLGIPSQSYAEGTATIGGVTFEYSEVGNYGNGIQVRDKVADGGKASMFWNTTAFGAGIKEIVLVYSANKSTYDNPDAEIFTFGNALGEVLCTVKLTTVAGEKNYTITPDADTYTFFKFEHDYSYTCYWDSITIVLTNGTIITPPTEEPVDPQPPVEDSTYPVVNELKNGDVVIIGAPAHNMALSADKVSEGSYYNKGVDYSAGFATITDAELFVVTVNADGSYTFTSKTGVVIALAGSYSSLNADGANKSWELIAKDGATGIFYLKNTVRGNYLEWYASMGNWSTYATSSLDDLFELSFYLVEGSTETPVDPQPPVEEPVDPQPPVEEPVDPQPPVQSGNAANLDSFTKNDPNLSDTSYGDWTSAEGWTLTYGRTDEQAAFGEDPQIILDGSAAKLGILKSCLLTGGVKSVSFNYGYAFNESNGVSVKINILDKDGNVVATADCVDTTLAKGDIGTFTWTLDAAVSGEFYLEIVNNCPSGAASGNKDRYSLWNLTWENA